MIVAIGAQNAYVLSQGVRRNYHFYRIEEKSAYDFDLPFECMCNRSVTAKVIRGVRGTLGSSYTDEQIVGYQSGWFVRLVPHLCAGGIEQSQ